jgi:phenylacetic acid degradation operon negative regulatory protein
LISWPLRGAVVVELLATLEIMPAATDPPQVSTPSARSLLLTVLGEAVAPKGDQVWQETLVAALELLDIAPQTARQAVARASRDDWFTSERIGRRSLMTLTPTTLQRLREGRERTFSYGAPVPWNGRWLLATLTVPEEHRDLRHQFRTQLAWLGFGSLGNGVWISPHTRNSEAALRLLNNGDRPSQALLFVTETPLNRDPGELARTAWDLDSLRGRHQGFYRTYAHMNPSSPSRTFAAWIAMINSWRHFPLFDPELPDSLLPADWQRQRAADLFHRCDQAWSEIALEHFRSLDPS